MIHNITWFGKPYFGRTFPVTMEGDMPRLVLQTQKYFECAYCGHVFIEDVTLTTLHCPRCHGEGNHT
jgi:Zn finger protein HypA/HybF involved in hydrogenase expression